METHTDERASVFVNWEIENRFAMHIEYVKFKVNVKYYTSSVMEESVRGKQCTPFGCRP